MSRILTALQPSGVLHIGNYFGAIEPFVSSQKGNDNFLFIVDYHAITVPQKPEELRKNILFAAATYLACGVDPNSTLLYQQSRVSAHTELAWILNCIARMGELSRMTQFKDKINRVKFGRDVVNRLRAEEKNSRSLPTTEEEVVGSASVGLFDYPILMAADILLYDTDIVPVGEDQKQHVELARDLAERFNRDFGNTFTIPQPQIRKTGARIMGLDDPTKKMSKSASSSKNYISLLDDEKTIRKKIMAAVTDTGKTIKFSSERPGLMNLMVLYALLAEVTVMQVEKDYIEKGYGDFKKDLAELLVLFLLPLQAKIHAYLKDETELKRVLDAGAQKANELAERKMKLVRERIGVLL